MIGMNPNPFQHEDEIYHLYIGKEEATGQQQILERPINNERMTYSNYVDWIINSKKRRNRAKRWNSYEFVGR